MAFVSGVFSLAMWLPANNVATIIAFVCLYGFSSGIFISVMPAVVAQISPDDKIGARIGALFTLAGVATLIGTPIAGSLVDRDAVDGYRSLILFGVSERQLQIRRTSCSLAINLSGSHKRCRRCFVSSCEILMRQRFTDKMVAVLQHQDTLQSRINFSAITINQANDFRCEPISSHFADHHPNVLTTRSSRVVSAPLKDRLECRARSSEAVRTFPIFPRADETASNERIMEVHVPRSILVGDVLFSGDDEIGRPSHQVEMGAYSYSSTGRVIKEHSAE